jgi:hypothetical protein
MIEDINFLIELVGGNSNALTIFALLIGIIISLFLYFKTFYRLVYSTETICENIKELGDWVHEQDVYITRVLFYNNGRKTLSKSEIKNLIIATNKEILSVRILEETKMVKFYPKKNKINIDIEYLDSSKYFALEIKHKGHISVEGRISETGQILHTEPRYWIVINIIFMGYIMFSLFNIMLHFEDEFFSHSNNFINFILLICLGIIIRIIHSFLFIPDSLTTKYLEPKDKWKKEFSTNF